MRQTAIVTGASRGIGFETAIELAKQNCSVVAVARTTSSLRKLEKKFPKLIAAFSADLTDAKNIRELCTFTSQNTDGIDMLINNAGALINKPFEELEQNDWRQIIDINLLANVQLTKSLLPQFQNPSHIVNISSMGGFQGSAKFPGLSAYSVAKGAVSILSECLAVELSERNIRVNALCLGAVQTEMLTKAFPGFEAPVTAGEMGKYIADFALNASTFYNGQILPVTLDDPE